MIDVTGIVPSHNSERTIRQCLRSLESNKVREIIVVDGGSIDRTLALASRFPLVRIIPQTRPLGRARELGWTEAKSEFVLFLDADAYLQHDNDVELLLQHMSSPEVAGVSCRVACANPERILPRLRDIDFQLVHPTDFKRTEVLDCIANPALCGLFRRDLLMTIQGTSWLDFDYAEDLYVLNKLRSMGYRILTVYNPPAFHYHREDLRGVFSQFYCQGFGRRALVNDIGEGFYRHRNAAEVVRRLSNVHSSWSDRLAYPIYRITTETAFLLGYGLEASRRLSRVV